MHEFVRNVLHFAAANGH